MDTIKLPRFWLALTGSALLSGCGFKISAFPLFALIIALAACITMFSSDMH